VRELKNQTARGREFASRDQVGRGRVHSRVFNKGRPGKEEYVHIEEKGSKVKKLARPGDHQKRLSSGKGDEGAHGEKGLIQSGEDL